MRSVSVDHHRYRRWLILFVALQQIALAQNLPTYQSDFPPGEFKLRWEKLFDKIGGDAIALVQGAPPAEGFARFRQSNEFYYLCGVETPGAYIVLDGRSRKVSLYLPHRDEEREAGEGKLLSVEDAELVKKYTGVDRVASVEKLARDWMWTLYWTATPPALYTPFSPAEGYGKTRDQLEGFKADIAADIWDGRPSREGQFLQLLRSRFPEFSIRNLSPILDTLRNIKSSLEMKFLRAAARYAARGLTAAMQSTRAGVLEYQLGAVAQYLFMINGAQGSAYNAIVAGGKNAMMGHYGVNHSALSDGDLVLMDYAPDYHYYASDVTRMWPVNGTFSPAQRQLCTFILQVRDIILKRIRPGRTADQIHDEAAGELRTLVDKTPWLKPIYRAAALATIDRKNEFSHPVGMAVHDVGNYHPRPLEVGVVFSLDPGIVVPEEQLLVRIEDVLVVTADGVENLSREVPAEPEKIEALMKEKGMLQLFPAEPLDMQK